MPVYGVSQGGACGEVQGGQRVCVAMTEANERAAFMAGCRIREAANAECEFGTGIKYCCPSSVQVSPPSREVALQIPGVEPQHVGPGENIVSKVAHFGEQLWGAFSPQAGMQTGKGSVAQHIGAAVNQGMNAGAADAGVLPAAPPSLFQSVAPRLPWILGGVLVIVSGVVIYKVATKEE